MSEVEKEPVIVPVEEPKAEEKAPEVVPVAAQAPSSSVVAEIVADVERAIPSLEDAVRNLVALVKDHRRAGDVDVEDALKDLDAAMAAKQ